MENERRLLAARELLGELPADVLRQMLREAEADLIRREREAEQAEQAGRTASVALGRAVMRRNELIEALGDRPREDSGG